MRKWNVLVLLVAAGWFGSSPVTAQTGGDDLRREVEALKEQNRQILKILADEREARQKLERQATTDQGVSGADAELERYINDLSSRMVDATTITSVANPINITGEFRFRTGWTANRNFGLPANFGCTGAGLVGSELGLLGPGCLNFLFFLQNPNQPQPQAGDGYYWYELPTNIEYSESVLEGLFEADEDEAFLFQLFALAVSGAAGAPRGIFDADQDDNGSFTDARIRVAFQFELMRDVSTYWELQSYGAFDNGVTPYPSATAPFNDATDQLSEVDLYQGYVEFRCIFDRPELSTRMGRQEIVFGNEFQFGNNDFFSGESFDGWKGTWQSEQWSLSALALKLQSHTLVPGTGHPFGFDYDDDDLYGLYFTFTGIENHSLDLYWIYMNAHNHFPGSFGTDGGLRGGMLFHGIFNEAYYHTFGGRIGGTLNVAAGLDWNVEGAVQIGDYSDPFGAFPVPDLSGDVAGFSVEAEVGLTFESEYHFRVFGRFLFADGPDDHNETGYLPLFPERHSSFGPRRARYGLMDIIPMYNVISGQLGVTVEPAANWTIGLTGLFAAHDEDVFTISESGGVVTMGIDDGIGWEIDLFVEHRYSEQATLSLGVGFFLPNDGAPLAGFFPLDRAIGSGEDDMAFLAFIQTQILF